MNANTITYDLENAYKMLFAAFRNAGLSIEESNNLSREALKNGDFEKMVMQAVSEM